MKPQWYAAVIRHLEPNIRIHLSQRCPSLQEINTSLPLKIENLYFGPVHFKINTIPYRLGIVRHYTRGVPPEFIQEENDAGGVQYDVDEFGDSERPAFKKRMEHDEIPTYKVKQEMEKSLYKLQEELYYERSREQTPSRVNQVSDLQEQVNTLRADIAHYQVRIQTPPPKFRHYFSFNMETVDQILVLGHARYTKRIQDAQEYCIRRIFGGLKIHVKTLKIDSRSLESDWKLQVPLEFAMVSILDFYGIDSDLETLQSVSPSIPTVILNSELMSYSNPIIQSAKKLVINGASRPDCLLETVGNSRVYRNDERKFTIDQAKNLVENWIEQKYPRGRHYSVELQTSQGAKELLGKIGELGNGRRGIIKETSGKMFPYCINFPIEGTKTEINVYCNSAFTKNSKSLQGYFYVLNFVINRKGYANLL